MDLQEILDNYKDIRNWVDSIGKAYQGELKIAERAEMKELLKNTTQHIKILPPRIKRYIIQEIKGRSHLYEKDAGEVIREYARTIR